MAYSIFPSHDYKVYIAYDLEISRDINTEISSSLKFIFKDFYFYS